MALRPIATQTLEPAPLRQSALDGDYPMLGRFSGTNPQSGSQLVFGERVALDEPSENPHSGI